MPALPSPAPPPSASPTRASWPARMLRALLTAAAFVCVLEGALRMVGGVDQNPMYRRDPDLFWRPRAHVTHLMQSTRENTGETSHTPISTNSLGLRDDEIPAAEPGEVRVLVVGDSSTFGHGVPLAMSYGKRLEKLLAAALPGRKVRVVNGGVPGYSSFQGRTWFHEIAPIVQPQVVVAAYLFSDRIPDVMPDKSRVPPGFFQSSLSRALSRSHVFQFVRDEVAAWRLRQRLSGTDSPGSPRVSLEDYQANLAAIMTEARAMGAQPMLLVLTPRPQPSPDSGLPPYRQAAAAAAAGCQATAVDMQAPFARCADPSRLFLDSVHPSPEGHEIIARELFDAMQASGIVRSLAGGKP